MGARPEDEPSVAPLLGTLAAHARLVRGDRAGLPLARPALGHAVGRRGPAHEDDPPPRLLAHRRHLRLRRAHHRPAPARHPAHEHLLLRLRDKGNTVLVVEHKPEVIAIADHVVDLGPGAGTAGGSICFEGSVEELRASGTLTGRHLDDRAALKQKVRTPTGALPSAAPRRTTCATSMSTSRSACSSSSPAWPARARARWCTARFPPARAWCPSTRARSAARGAATRPPTPGCSTRSATPSPRPTA
jgi:hypothetical protein